MGYNPSFRTTQKRFQRNLRRKHYEVLVIGVQDYRSYPKLEPSVLRFLALKDMSDDVKGEIILLTRYLLDFFRERGFKRSSDKFAKKANMDEEQPLDGSFLEYWDLWFKTPPTMGYWAFFCQQKLKALKEHTLQGNALDTTITNQHTSSVNQSSLGQSYTSTNRVHLSHQQFGQDSGHAMHSELRTSPDSGMITILKRFLFPMLRKITFDYFIGLGFRYVFGSIHKEPETDDEEQPHDSLSGSTSSNSDSIATRVKKRRLCSG